MPENIVIRKYNRDLHQERLLEIINNEEDWDYAEDHLIDKYRLALENSISYVATIDDIVCGYSRSINDNDLYIFVCDLLVDPKFRGNEIGRLLMEQVLIDYPGFEVFVMSDVDEYYRKLGYKLEGSLFQVVKV